MLFSTLCLLYGWMGVCRGDVGVLVFRGVASFLFMDLLDDFGVCGRVKVELVRGVGLGAGCLVSGVSDASSSALWGFVLEILYCG